VLVRGRNGGAPSGKGYGKEKHGEKGKTGIATGLSASAACRGRKAKKGGDKGPGRG